MAWDALAVYTNAGHMLLCGGSAKLQIKWHLNQTGDGAVKAGLRLLVLGLLRAQLSVLYARLQSRASTVWEHFSTSYMAVVPW